MYSEELPVVDGEVLLTEDDLPTLLDVLYDVAHKWERIATYLKLSQGAIAIIKSKEVAEPEDKLLEVMKRWLSRTSPAPTVETLINALRRPFVGEEKIALELEGKFYPQSFHSKSL